MNEYLRWQQKIEIERRANILVLKVFYDNNHEKKVKKWKDYAINDTAYEIIKLVNGMMTYDQIICCLSEKYNEEPESIKEKVDRFYERLQSDYKLTLITSEQVAEKREEFNEKESYYPKAASVEITNACNLKCLHCYGDFGTPLRAYTMTFEKIRKIFDDLNDVGIEIVELTGGDITMHPQINDIIKYALSLNFIKIALLTNGVLLKEDTLKLIIDNKERVVVQIDLHSLNDNYLSWFTGVKDTIVPICNNIVLLSENGVTMRVAVMVTQHNINELEHIADWIYHLNNATLGVGIVSKMGRAKENDELVLNDDNIMLLNDIIIRIQEKYKNFLSIIDDFDNAKSNCGCLSSAIAVTPKGKLKLCAMDTGEYFDIGLGNLSDKSIKTIYDDNKDFIKKFTNIKAPQVDTEQCKDCEHIAFCGKCLLRSLVRASELKDNCKWYRECVPDIVKQKIIM